MDRNLQKRFCEIKIITRVQLVAINCNSHKIGRPAIVDGQKMAPNLGVSPSSFCPGIGIRKNSDPVEKFWKNRLP
jgi:hypothetical protein